MKSASPTIYPSTALKNQQKEIKTKADEGLVYITENGWGKYLFTSIDVFQKYVADAVEEALYAERLKGALSQSRKDFEEEHYYSTREQLINAVAKKREASNASA